MRGGALDRRIQLMEKVVTQDDFGEEIVSWNTIATVYAEKIENTGQERFSVAQFVGKRVCSFEFRWSSAVKGVTTLHKIIFDEVEFDIVAVQEIGRREGIRCDCTARSEEPIAP